MKTLQFIAVLTLTMLCSVVNAQYFSVIAARSGSPIHLQVFNANGGRIWIGKATASYCPPKAAEEGACSPDDEDGTNFILGGSGSGSLAMGTQVPGGQQVYIDPACGAIGYTQPHSADMPDGAVVTGWDVDQGASYGFLSWDDGVSGAGGFFACSATGNSTLPPWQVFVELGGMEFGEECLGFDALTGNDTSPFAWEYV